MAGTPHWLDVHFFVTAAARACIPPKVKTMGVTAPFY